ncbi:MAG: hypothetical protein PF482_16110 [Desulfobacteraceae bacterium]|jgi:hypothetical protein|nr:hypothetical protein [Desulfobacteraceae bacterium]
MTPQEKEPIQKTLKGLETKITIRIHMTEDNRGVALLSFCDELQALNPGIRIKKENHEAGLP